MIDIPELGDIPGSTYAVIGISALALLAYRRRANSGSVCPTLWHYMVDFILMKPLGLYS